MDRREFTVGALTVLATGFWNAPAGAKIIDGVLQISDGPVFDPNAEYGNSLIWYGSTWSKHSQDSKSCLLDWLHHNAALSLKPGMRYEIRMKLPSDYGRSHGLAWYHSGAFHKPRTRWKIGPTDPILDPELGIWRLGRFETPKNAQGQGVPLDELAPMPQTKL